MIVCMIIYENRYGTDVKLFTVKTTSSASGNNSTDSINVADQAH